MKMIDGYNKDYYKIYIQTKIGDWIKIKIKGEEEEGMSSMALKICRWIDN